MPLIGSSSTTASPAAGLLVVLSVTVPVTLAARAPALAKINPQKNAAARKSFNLISCRYPSFRQTCCFVLWPLSSRLLERVNLSHQLRGFFLQLPALRIEVLFGILADAILKVQVAQVLVELLPALQQKIQPRLFLLAGKTVLRPERVEKQHDQQKESRDQSLRLVHGSESSVAASIAANPFQPRQFFVAGRRGSDSGGSRIAAQSAPAFDQKNCAQQRSRKHSEGRDPCHQV